VRCIFRPAGLPRRALHFSTGVHTSTLAMLAAGLACGGYGFHPAETNASERPQHQPPSADFPAKIGRTPLIYSRGITARAA
jgi:hypothetical protein